MAARFTVTRAEAIAAAAALYAGEDDMQKWRGHEYTRGITEVLADAFGADVEDHDQAKEEIWHEIVTAQRALELEARASAYATFTLAGAAHDGLDYPDVHSAVVTAFLAGHQAAAS